MPKIIVNYDTSVIEIESIQHKAKFNYPFESLKEVSEMLYEVLNAVYHVDFNLEQISDGDHTVIGEW